MPKEKTASVNVNRKGKILYYIDSESLDDGVELEIDTGDQHRTRYQFKFVDGEVQVKKVNWAGGKDGCITSRSSASNIIYIK